MSHPFGSPAPITVELDLESEQAEIIVPEQNAVFHVHWSYETVRDLQSSHNLDAENALHDAIVAEITAELDREIIGDINIALSTPTPSPQRELPFLSQEALDDIYAWQGEWTTHVYPERQKDKVDWKNEGF